MIEIDLIVFAGQSNMAGRGDANKAPVVTQKAAYEFRSVSDSTQLHPLTEPFGVDENRGELSENLKTGSLVSSFVTAYFEKTNRVIVGVSAAKGGTTVEEWQPSGGLLPEAISRYLTAEKWLTENNYIVRNKWLIWCQGESDGDISTPKEMYKQRLSNVIQSFEEAGVEHSFIICIGKNRDNLSLYTPIIEAQTEFCHDTENVELIATIFGKMAEAGLMKDEFHYTQAGYNLCGEEAGNNLARWYCNQRIELDY